MSTPTPIPDEQFDVVLHQYEQLFGNPMPDSQAMAFAFLAQDHVYVRLLQAVATGVPITNWFEMEREILDELGGRLVLTPGEVERRL